MKSVAFRTALLTDLPGIVALLADDELGRGREATGSPLDERYVAAFKAIEADRCSNGLSRSASCAAARSSS
jgi:hypothetical protein